MRSSRPSGSADKHDVISRSRKSVYRAPPQRQLSSSLWIHTTRARHRVAQSLARCARLFEELQMAGTAYQKCSLSAMSGASAHLASGHSHQAETGQKETFRYAYLLKHPRVLCSITWVGARDRKRSTGRPALSVRRGGSHRGRAAMICAGCTGTQQHR